MRRLDGAGEEIEPLSRSEVAREGGFLRRRFTSGDRSRGAWRVKWKRAIAESGGWPRISDSLVTEIGHDWPEAGHSCAAG